MEEKKLRGMAEKMILMGQEILNELNDLEKEKEKEPSLKEFMTFWCEEYEKFHHVKYHVCNGKDHAIIKTLLKSFPMDDLKRLSAAFFTSNDPFIKQAGWTIGVFNTQINKLNMKYEKTGIYAFMKKG